jgi:hypothetical protein
MTQGKDINSQTVPLFSMEINYENLSHIVATSCTFSDILSHIWALDEETTLNSSD